MLSFIITTILIRNSLTYGNIEEEIYKNGGNGIMDKVGFEYGAINRLNDLELLVEL